MYVAVKCWMLNEKTSGPIACASTYPEMKKDIWKGKRHTAPSPSNRYVKRPDTFNAVLPNAACTIQKKLLSGNSWSSL